MILFRTILFVTAVGIGSVVVRNTTDMLSCAVHGERCVQEQPDPAK
jgi:hypothetical protein